MYSLEADATGILGEAEKTEGLEEMLDELENLSDEEANRMLGRK